MRLGIIRCQQTEDFCPGNGCFKAVKKRKGVFEGSNEEIEIIGFTTCGFSHTHRKKEAGTIARSGWKLYGRRSAVCPAQSVSFCKACASGSTTAPRSSIAWAKSKNSSVWPSRNR